MEILKRFVPIDYSKYEGDSEEDLEAWFGLPKEVKFCKKCVLSNQRPNSAVETKVDVKQIKTTLHFDKDGVCDGCNATKMKESGIDWKAREEECIALCDKYRRNDGRYDCLVPGSGGKDSFYAAYLLKHKYHMHPLSITWSPHIYTEWGYKNFQAWIGSGLDNILVTPNSLTHRLITRLATEVLLNPFQPFFIGQKNIAPKIAAKFGIPLIFYGEHEAEYGNPIAENKESLMSQSFFTLENKEAALFGGVPYKTLVSDFKVDPVDLNLYLPMTPEELEKHDVEVHYMGYYENWHPKYVGEFAMKHSGFRPAPERSTGSYTNYCDLDDKMGDLHWYTYFIKFGIGRASYEAPRELWHGELTREEAVEIVKKYDGEWPERFEDELMRYLSIPEEEFPEASKMFEQPIMDKEYFMHLCDRFRSPHLWKYSDGKWSLRHTVY